MQKNTLQLRNMNFKNDTHNFSSQNGKVEFIFWTYNQEILAYVKLLTINKGELKNA